MKKVGKLEGATLDLWVARAEGRCLHEKQRASMGEGGTEYFCEVCDEPIYGSITRRDWKPSTNWLQGGPIIERERLEIMLRMTAGEWQGEWRAINIWSDRENRYAQAYGDTPLIAAMRCFVASKFGAEVDD
ncbi:MAG: phage protein NinX family protein [Pseudomonadota bacterium]